MTRKELVEKMAQAFNQNFNGTDGELRKIFMLASDNALQVVLDNIDEVVERTMDTVDCGQVIELKTEFRGQP